MPSSSPRLQAGAGSTPATRWCRRPRCSPPPPGGYKARPRRRRRTLAPFPLFSRALPRGKPNPKPHSNRPEPARFAAGEAPRPPATSPTRAR
jgi:hypothetical protein